jgi:hypothetical protein
MKSHFAWRPHLDRDSLFNPFAPSERTPTLGNVRLSEAYGDEVVNPEDSPPQIAEASSGMEAAADSGEKPSESGA